MLLSKMAFGFGPTNPDPRIDRLLDKSKWDGTIQALRLESGHPVWLAGATTSAMARPWHNEKELADWQEWLGNFLASADDGLLYCPDGTLPAFVRDKANVGRPVADNIRRCYGIPTVGNVREHVRNVRPDEVCLVGNFRAIVSTGLADCANFDIPTTQFVGQKRDEGAFALMTNEKGALEATTGTLPALVATLRADWGQSPSHTAILSGMDAICDNNNRPRPDNAFRARVKRAFAIIKLADCTGETDAQLLKPPTEGGLGSGFSNAGEIFELAWQRKEGKDFMPVQPGNPAAMEFVAKMKEKALNLATLSGEDKVAFEENAADYNKIVKFGRAWAEKEFANKRRPDATLWAAAGVAAFMAVPKKPVEPANVEPVEPVEPANVEPANVEPEKPKRGKRS